MKLIDKTVQAHAILNMTAAVVSSPNGIPTAQQIARERGCSIDIAIATLAESFAFAAIRNIESSDIVQLPAGSGLSDAIKGFLDASAAEGREEFERTLQEGELAQNAVAILSNDPGLWISDAQDGSVVAFPGSGADGGELRLNDLIRAAMYVFAEIRRVENQLAADHEYAQRAGEAGSAVMPGTEDGAVEAAVEKLGDDQVETPTQH